MALEAGSVAISSIKFPEEPGSRKLILRVFEIEGKETCAWLRFGRPVTAARLLDLNERPVANPANDLYVDGERVNLVVGPNRVATLEIGF